eukprot:TRINITY_DN27016_c0_g1_i1.p1 TRINITY_DN27016_c0_g1~~TRINITY_DN27016_c0_g1_i1.p1  ORF type:complete len:247 (+),score=44.39 TRINITY_DN27016_c0_g1_i1:65-742(+)
MAAIMRAAAGASQKLDTYLAAAHEYQTILQREEEGDAIGVIVIAMSNQTYKVLAVGQKGMIPSWNQTNQDIPDIVVEPGDTIMAVNGISGNLELMKMEFMKQSLVCTMTKQSNVSTAIKAGAAMALDDPVNNPPKAKGHFDPARFRDYMVILPAETPEPPLNRGSVPAIMATNYDNLKEIDYDDDAANNENSQEDNSDFEIWKGGRDEVPGRNDGPVCQPVCTQM